jgi:hypothetical protein
MKLFGTTNINSVPDDKFKIRFFLHSISMLMDKITDDPYLYHIINNIIDPQIDMIQYFIL